MKKILLLSFSLIAFSFLKAQQYIPFPDSNAVWVSISYDANCIGPVNLCGYGYTKIDGDTVLGNFSYKKVYSTYQNDTIYHFNGGIRQVIAEKKVYVKLISDGCLGNDTILYDFNLQIGDTLKQCTELLGGGGPFFITAIDSLFIANEWHKRFYSNSYFELIEGIGSTGGLFGPWTGWIGGNIYLNCFSLNGNYLFPDTSCNLYTVIKNNFQTQFNIQVFPNPVSDIFTLQIQVPNTTYATINISNFSSYFKTNIFSGNLKEGINKIEINSLGLKQGLYVLHFFCNKEEHSINKLIEIIH